MMESVLLVFSDERDVGDYLTCLHSGRLAPCLADGMSWRAPLSERSFDIALLMADHVGRAIGWLMGAGPGGRPIISVAPGLDEAAEATLLAAGATLCLPSTAGPETAVEWARHLLALAGRARAAGFEIDPETRRANFDGRDLALRPIEFDLLFCLARQAGRACRADELQARLWPGCPATRSRLTMAVHGLRRALAAAGAASRLETLPGLGYRLAPLGGTAPRLSGRRGRTPSA